MFFKRMRRNEKATAYGKAVIAKTIMMNMNMNRLLKERLVHLQESINRTKCSIDLRNLSCNIDQMLKLDTSMTRRKKWLELKVMVSQRELEVNKNDR